VSQKKPKRQLSSGLRLTVIAIVIGAFLVLFNWAGQWLDVEYEKEYWEIVLTIVGLIIGIFFIVSNTVKYTDENGLK
jgi:Na+/H+-translocating membrane pyrophosphatase